MIQTEQMLLRNFGPAFIVVGITFALAAAVGLVRGKRLTPRQVGVGGAVIAAWGVLCVMLGRVPDEVFSDAGFFWAGTVMYAMGWALELVGIWGLGGSWVLAALGGGSLAVGLSRTVSDALGGVSRPLVGGCLAGAMLGFFAFVAMEGALKRDLAAQSSRAGAPGRSGPPSRRPPLP
jgi:hypothetical protein